LISHTNFKCSWLVKSPYKTSNYWHSPRFLLISSKSWVK
jgi:hypothetical protein